MANMCDNHLEFFCKAKPDWLKIDPETSHGISVEVDPHFLFLYNDFESITCDLQDDGTFWIEFGFETKWAPPEDLYASMIADENIISFNAVWYEPGCGVLGYANKDEGVQHEDAPDRNYSECLDKDVLKSEPPQCYTDIEGTDTWVTYEKYKTDIEELRKEIPSNDLSALQGLGQEIIEMEEYFSEEENDEACNCYDCNQTFAKPDSKMFDVPFTSDLVEANCCPHCGSRNIINN